MGKDPDGLLHISWAGCVQIFFDTVAMMNRLIELKGVEHLWLIMLLKDNNTSIDMIKYVASACRSGC